MAEARTEPKAAAARDGEIAGGAICAGGSALIIKRHEDTFEETCPEREAGVIRTDLRMLIAGPAYSLITHDKLDVDVPKFLATGWILLKGIGQHPVFRSFIGGSHDFPAIEKLGPHDPATLHSMTRSAMMQALYLQRHGVFDAVFADLDHEKLMLNGPVIAEAIGDMFDQFDQLAENDAMFMSLQSLKVVTDFIEQTEAPDTAGWVLRNGDGLAIDFSKLGFPMETQK